MKSKIGKALLNFNNKRMVTLDLQLDELVLELNKVLPEEVRRLRVNSYGDPSYFHNIIRSIRDNCAEFKSLQEEISEMIIIEGYMK